MQGPSGRESPWQGFSEQKARSDLNSHAWIGEATF